MLQQLQLFPPTSDNIREDASGAERAQLGACDDASIARRQRAPTTPVVRGKGREYTISDYYNKLNELRFLYPYEYEFPRLYEFIHLVKGFHHSDNDGWIPECQTELYWPVD